VAGGTALPGSACNDNNSNTINDVWSANCQCVGTPVTFDCEGVANGSALPGTPCNDGDPMTVNDAWDSNCNCYGFLYLVDCAGEVGGYAIPGTPCNDGDPLTGNDVWSTNCTCIGLPLDCAGVPGGSAVLDDCGICSGGNTGIDPDADDDQDGLVACEDNCSLVYNPNQADYDNDGVGDACDNCVWLPNGDQEDLNGNGIGDACESGVGMSEVDAAAPFTLYPNPARGPVHVRWGQLPLDGMDIYSAQGALVRSFGQRSVIEVDDLATGIYTVVARDAVGRPIARAKLIRQ
jgi:hypothetical protein